MLDSRDGSWISGVSGHVWRAWSVTRHAMRTANGLRSDAAGRSEPSQGRTGPRGFGAVDGRCCCRSQVVCPRRFLLRTTLIDTASDRCTPFLDGRPLLPRSRCVRLVLGNSNLGAALRNLAGEIEPVPVGGQCPESLSHRSAPRGRQFHLIFNRAEGAMEPAAGRITGCGAGF